MEANRRVRRQGAMRQGVTIHPTTANVDEEGRQAQGGAPGPKGGPPGPKGGPPGSGGPPGPAPPSPDYNAMAEQVAAIMGIGLGGGGGDVAAALSTSGGDGPAPGAGGAAVAMDPLSGPTGPPIEHPVGMLLQSG